MGRLTNKLMNAIKVLDALKLVPRAVTMIYAIMLMSMFGWYTTLNTITIQECDHNTAITLLDKKYTDADKAFELTCHDKEVIGGPTSEQTTFVSIMIGLSTAIFGLYTASIVRAGKSKSKTEEVE